MFKLRKYNIKPVEMDPEIQKLRNYQMERVNQSL